jgi:hypothetical protein
MSERKEETGRGMYWGNLKNGMHAVDLGVDGIILLERTLKNSVLWVWTGWIWL